MNYTVYYIVHLLTMFSIYAILGVSLNLVVGYTGLVSVTQAAFYGIGAYATALIAKTAGFGFFSSMLIGVIVAGLIGLLIGLVLSKFRDDYYVIVTVGFNIIAYGIFMNWHSLTRGPLGIVAVPRPKIDFLGLHLDFNNNLLFLALVLVFLALIYFLARFIAKSSFGRVLKAIREDEKAIQVFGYNAFYFKLAIFVISAGMAAVAGSFFASYLRFTSPNTFVLMESVLILSMIILGGLANLKGSLLGAFILVLLPELMRFVGFPNEIAAEMRQIVYGVILVLLMIYKPSGIMGEYKL
ncbi:MAG: inner-membrane translocator, branched-chain amino acid transport system permease protein [Candidatus Peregrinibacteria bacterium GW2011_GWF2_38_29]|nr:MAG: inner-membrane translocator, branched-chain amino acid transport system permease protein [Candidatus Peregrinibacteria bacterium GW2011_GWF2_38_29]HBB02563.1 branched-chain amino acid ABC transporter permease [Candidatus Peregrinibacteria bacterium]